MKERHALEQELKKLNSQLKDAEGRMPAHSAKPVMMQRIFELEEERETILRKLKRLSAKTEDI